MKEAWEALRQGSYGADLEKAQLVTGRIDCAFHKTYRHSRASLTFRMAALRPGSGG